MTESIKENRIKSFIDRWREKGNEREHTQTFWIELLAALGVSKPTELANFEKPVFVNGHKKRIDVYMAETKVLVEQKSFGIDLNAKERQSDDVWLTPYEQGKRYADNLPFNEKPSRLIVCNFEEIRIHDMNDLRPEQHPIVVKLADLEKEYKYLHFLNEFFGETVQKEEAVSVEAGKIIKRLYNLLRDRYIDRDSKETLEALNILCVRLVFLMYCEDAGILEQNQFKQYIHQFQPEHLRRALKDLFVQLDIRESERDPYLSKDIAAFPYINGGLFRQQSEIPNFTQEIVDALMEAENFDWSSISAPIFGACYESTINPATRQQNGMHYTKTEDVAKLLDNLFLDDLRAGLSKIKVEPIAKKKKQALLSLQEKLSKIGVADFAAGSGNFGVEAYLGLRRLENEILQELYGGQQVIDEAFNPIKVSIGQITLAEIEDFAADVCRVSLWIAEAQMLKETEAIISKKIEYFPLSTEARITICDSLTVDWTEIAPKDRTNYLVMNPPYRGARVQTPEQKAALLNVYRDENGKPYKNAGNIDYVAGWMFKAAEYIQGTDIRCAFVTTNSVTQGEQVANIWKPLYERFGIHIDFAYRTFKWNNGTEDMAAVHCVIFGFSSAPRGKNCLLYDFIKNESGEFIPKPAVANNINPYLTDAPIVFVESRNKPLFINVPKMDFGSMPNDGKGLLSDYSPERKEEIVAKYPGTEKLFRRIYGAEEFINNRERYCLWLKGVSPDQYMNVPPIKDAIRRVKEVRENSNREATRHLADYPMLFGEIRQPEKGFYLLIPSTSSENRDYIPMGFMNANIISTNANLIIPNASLYLFGVLTSMVHLYWMRTVAGRLEMRYRYSAKIVYNNFPWPTPTDEQKAKIEETAQGILDARALYPDASLADLYDEVTMPPELRKAHQENDRAVMRAYGFDVKTTTEASCVAALMKMYQKLTAKEETAQ